MSLSFPCFFHAVACLIYSLTPRDPEFAEKQQQQQQTVALPLSSVSVAFTAPTGRMRWYRSRRGDWRWRAVCSTAAVWDV